MANPTITREQIDTTIDGLSAKFLAASEALSDLAEALDQAAGQLQHATLTTDDMAAINHAPILADSMLKGLEVKAAARFLVASAGLSA